MRMCCTNRLPVIVELSSEHVKIIILIFFVFFENSLAPHGCANVLPALMVHSKKKMNITGD